MIRLRKLEEKDVIPMMEWMHDEESKTIFQNDFMSIDENKALNFIQNSFSITSQNFAIVDDEDEYLGTISLKNIDYKNSNAEYAISMRNCARGTGAARDGSMLLLDYAFNSLGLHKVYLCVLETNIRAKKFYEKIGFQFEGNAKGHLFHENRFKDLYWYSILESDYKNGK